MKTPFVSAPSVRFLLGLAVAFAGALRPAHAEETVLLTPQQVDELMGPIALYPDALVALILPASTIPADIVLAQRYLSSGGDPEQIDYQPWNESVKGLARYPMLIQWLDENLTWTRQLGSAFVNQPDDLMNSVQRLRARAKANGTLTSTPQQKLVLDGDVIEIVPAQPDVIYVPYYDPTLVYGGPVYYGAPPYVTFGVGFSVGYWLSYDCNWHKHVIVVGDRHHNWHTNHDWKHHPAPAGRPNYGKNWRPWTPPANRTPYTRSDTYRSYPGGVVRPRPLARGPNDASRDRRPDGSSQRGDNNGRSNDHNRAPTSSGNSGWTQPSPDHRPPSNSGSRPDSRPQTSGGMRTSKRTNPSAGPQPSSANPQQPLVPAPPAAAATSDPQPRQPRSHSPGRTNPSPGPQPIPPSTRPLPAVPMPLPPAATPNPQSRQASPQAPGMRPPPLPQSPGTQSVQPPPPPQAKPVAPPPIKSPPRDNPRDDKPDVQR